MLSNLILSTSGVLLQGVVLGILLVVAASFFLRLAGEFNGSTRGLVWLATLIALPLIPVLCWTNQISAPTPQPAAVRPIAFPVVHQTAAAAPVVAAVAPPSRQLDFSVSRDTPIVLFTVYSIVATLMLFRLFIAYLSIRLLRRRAHPAPAGVQARLANWLERCPTNRSVEVRLSDTLRSPIAIGFLRPMILIPAALTLELSEEEFDDVGVHELAHIRRYDDWANLLRQLLQALLFFHPAVYWAGRRLKFECEVACDDWVVSARGSKSYARCLAKVVELRRWERGALLSSGAFFSKAQILRRVELLLDKTRNSTTGISGFTTVAIVLITVGITLQVARIPAMVSISHDDSDSHINAEWKDGEHDMRVRMRGEMTLTPDERSIATLSPRGYVEIQESRGWSTRRLEVRPSSSGAPEQKYFVDGHERPLDASGRDWTAATYAFLAREMGIDIDGRIERIMAGKGVAGLLNEVDLIRSGNIKAKYLTRLLDRNDLSDDDLRRVAIAIRKIPSDHEKAELLRTSASRFAGDSARREYYHAVDSIRSDNDKAAVLLTQSGCAALRTAATIHSDFDKARVLRESGVTGASECREAFFEVANQIRSDNDRSNVLRSVLERSDMEPAVYESVATAAMRMSSDNDKANVLARLGQHYREPAFFEAVNTMRSDQDRMRVLHQVLNGEPSKAVLLAVIEAASRMNSDNEKAQILVAAAKLSTDSEVRSALKEACGKLRSDNDYRRVATALLRF